MLISEAASKLIAGTPHQDHFHPGEELQIEATSGWRERLPKNGKVDPIENDRLLPFDLGEIERLGVSGWNYRDRESRFVILDVDAKDGHEKGLDEAGIQRVLEAAQSLSYVQIHRSKSGKGFHLYIWLATPIPASPRKEHTLVATAIVEQMKADSGFDFAAYLDCRGVIGWIWAVNAAPNAFELVKEATSRIQLSQDWRDIANAVQRRGKKNAPDGLTFNSPPVEMDERHKEYLDWLTKNGWEAILDEHEGHHILRTHTRGLKEMHEALKLPGIFDTVSAGSNPYEPNCFAFFRDNGGLAVRRYNPGVPEADCWQQGSGGWTCCDFGLPSTLEDAAKAFEGIEDETIGFAFDSESALSAVQAMGGEFSVPDLFNEREVLLKPHNDGKRLVAEVQFKPNDPTKVPGWRKKGRKWLQVVEASLDIVPQAQELVCDDIRHVGTVEGNKLGWTLKIDDVWIEQTKNNCQSVLLNRGLNRTQADAFLGGCILQMWKLVDRPFQPEYPGGREWNRFGAQFAYEPTSEDRPMHHPHFDMVLEHCGAGLTPAVRQDSWCQKNGIKTGADWLRVYMASVFQRPFQILPFLFFYGPQNGGKSSYHEMFDVLMTKGYKKVDKAFIRDTTFNSEFSGTLVAVIEEANLMKHPEKNYNTIKDITTARKIAIERKGWDVYETDNMLHCIQCTNSHLSCPILEEDDSRVVVIEVPALPLNKRIKKEILRERWAKEAADFTRTLLDLKLPKPSSGDDRLYLPVLLTPAKWKVIEGVARIRQLKPSRRPAGILAQQIEETIRLMASFGWIIKLTVTQILKLLRSWDIPELPEEPEQIGEAIRMMNLDGLHFDSGRRGAGRWITIATPQAIMFYELSQNIERDDWTEEELFADEILMSEFPVGI